MMLACSGGAPVSPPTPVVQPLVPAPPPHRPISTPRLAAGPSAFDLITTSDGAALIWGGSPDTGGGVHYLPLTPFGEVAGRVGTLASVRGERERGEMVRELVATSASGVTFVAWITRGAGHRSYWSYARASLREPQVFANPSLLAASVDTQTLARGNLAISATEPDTATLFARLVDAPCANAADDSCAVLQRTVLHADGRAETDAASQMLLDHTCERPIVGLEYVSSTQFFALSCGAPATTFYSVRRDVPYASALPLASGCQASGLVASRGGATLRAECDGRSTWTEVSTMGAAAQPLSAPALVKCEAAGPTLRVVAQGRELSLPLRAQRNNLGAWLAESIAPAGTRAVWTGQALLLAVPHGRDVSFRRYECYDGEFQRTDY